MRLALVAAGLCIAQGVPTSAACVVLAGTADGFDKDTAVSRAQLALEDYIKQYKAQNHLGAATVSAMRAEPQPYWRGRVSETMMYHPDIVTARADVGTTSAATPAVTPAYSKAFCVCVAMAGTTNRH